MTIPYLKRRARHLIGETGRKSERQVAKKHGAKLTPASGAMEGAKGDMTLGGFLIEAKSTTGDSIGVKHGYLGKIAHEARSQGKSPALMVTFTWPTGAPVPDGEWVMIPARLFKTFVALEANPDERHVPTEGEEVGAPGAEGARPPGKHDR